MKRREKRRRERRTGTCEGSGRGKKPFGQNFHRKGKYHIYPSSTNEEKRSFRGEEIGGIIGCLKSSATPTKEGATPSV